ncbi:hypothetical protein M406DRAFT_43017, partial [Cryphonectria parasitica EP155]
MHVDWLRRYATGYHRWRQTRDENEVLFYRPLGIVESSFDADGVYHEGRADINMALEFEISTNMSTTSLRRHILLVWTALRLRHVLLCSAASSTMDFMDEKAAKDSARWFIVRKPTSSEDAIHAADNQIAFLHDHYPATSSGTYNLRFLFIMSHQISDGLTNSNWATSFMRLLNTKSHDLEDSIGTLVTTLPERLPPAQEDLYQPISGSLARQRWFWAITLVLRHVQKPMPPAFQNPL